MQTAKLKTYAPKARRDFIAAVTRRAARFGLTAKGTSPVREEGQLVFIEGQPYPKAIGVQRQKLAARIEQQGFPQAMEAAAYTWFNRFAAIRFMELHGYLDHSFRVLSHPEGNALPEILEHAQHVDLPGLDREQVVDLKMDGTRDEELYRDLLLAQCHALHQAMPFLFERVDDETELLLPDNLLQTDSLIREMVTAIPEEEWQEIEIIGWLYQFYISEKKDQVIGKVVKSEDIPAATQLFTPNWIVKYMVQNSLGAQWLATYPHSPLKEQMAYYIEPAEQTAEVGAALAAITPDSLNPEELTLIDPASGSGHILVEAYELFKAIYLERGYRQREVARLILEKNLFGLDIDGRAAQLTGFALMMKGRADDRRLFGRGVRLNVMALVDSGEEVASGEWLVASGIVGAEGLADAVDELVSLFRHATTFGSLIQVPERLVGKLPALKQLSEAGSQDLFVADALKHLRRLVRQAEMLAGRYDAVVANPPYMGTGGMNGDLKSFMRNEYADYATDLCAAFIARAFAWLPPNGVSAQVNLQKWMFQSSFSSMRRELILHRNFESLVQIGFNSFPSMNSKIALGCAFVLRRRVIPGFAGRYVDLNSAPRSADKGAVFRARNTACDHRVCQTSFLRIPDTPIAYWGRYDAVFGGDSLGSTMMSGGRCKTHADHIYVRFSWEVSDQDVREGFKWRFYEKGGDFRKWYGNRLFVVNWSEPARRAYASKGGLTQERFWKRTGITWSDIALQSGFRLKLEDTEYSSVSPTIFPAENHDPDIRLLLLLNSSVVKWVLKALNPSLHANPGDVLKLPATVLGNVTLAEHAVEIAKTDWDSYEISREFSVSPILKFSVVASSLRECAERWAQEQSALVCELRAIEEENNSLYVHYFGLEGEVPIKVPIAEVSLTCNPAYRNKGRRSEGNSSHVRGQQIAELVSYAIGCMMGRYSLDESGLIYAHSGNAGFDPSRYASFPPDDDGIIPLTDTEWFDDDACHRLVEFISVAWDAAHLEDNLTFLADNLGPKKSESSRDTLRRYLCDKFFKDHLKTYKKRPIYWLFSSGKQKAIQCLVYLHRYNEGTLARMRMEYVVPLQSKMAARIDKLADDIQAATTSAQAKRLQKERDKLTRQLEELRRFDEQLRHYADLRIKLDLDDGVKVNYGKFGDLLAEVKAVTGKR